MILVKSFCLVHNASSCEVASSLCRYVNNFYRACGHERVQVPFLKNTRLDMDKIQLQNKLHELMKALGTLRQRSYQLSLPFGQDEQD